MIILLAGLGFASWREDDNDSREGGHDRPLVVMTRNMDEGTDFGPIFTATTFPQFAAEVAAAYVEVQQSNIPERAAALAKEIEAEQPHLIGLQEVSIWRTGPLGGPATTVTYDALQSLLDALAARGLHYKPIAVLAEFEAEAPSALGINIGFSDLDVLLARSDLDISELKLSNVEARHFDFNLPFTSPVLGTLTIPRGWIAVDGKIRGKDFRFVTTHLESFHFGVQAIQASELMQGPCNTELPVIIAGDLNTESPTGNPADNAAYQVTIGSGFADAWTVSHPGDAGFTWPLHLEDPFTPFATPNQRIDLVLYRGKVGLRRAELIGNTTLALTSSGLWPSDHAGVVVSINLKRDD
jgi:endonuclease/exonuclease/phosphatase family metal-dependent hydrolase